MNVPERLPNTKKGSVKQSLFFDESDCLESYDALNSRHDIVDMESHFSFEGADATFILSRTVIVIEE